MQIAASGHSNPDSFVMLDSNTQAFGPGDWRNGRNLSAVFEWQLQAYSVLNPDYASVSSRIQISHVYAVNFLNSSIKLFRPLAGFAVARYFAVEFNDRDYVLGCYRQK